MYVFLESLGIKEPHISNTWRIFKSQGVSIHHLITQQITEEDMKELGVPLGIRRTIWIEAPKKKEEEKK
jgi:hypothetical protein